MREDEMFDPVIEYFRKDGYEILQENRGHKHGIDVLASKNGNKTYIELKGDGDLASRDFRIGGALYQVMKRIKPDSHEDEYIIAITEQLRSFANDCRFAMEQLGIQVFIVDSQIEKLF